MKPHFRITLILLQLFNVASYLRLGLIGRLTPWVAYPVALLFLVWAALNGWVLWDGYRDSTAPDSEDTIQR